MRNFKSADKTGVDEAITNALKELAGHEAHTDEYAKIVDQLSKLNEIKTKKSDRISKDVLVTVAGNLAGVLVIVGYERMHVMTSKALSQIGRK